MLSEKARRKADEAKAKGLWLFEPGYNKWYTPEDFTHIFTYANPSDDFFDKVQLRDPNEAIAAGFKKLTEVQGKLEGFIKRVQAYYSKHK